MSRVETAARAQELAKIVLDAEVLPDEVRDLARSDDEFAEIAAARSRVGNAAKEANRDRRSELESIQFYLDGLAIERLRDLLDDAEIEVDEVTGSNPVIWKARREL